MKEETRSEQQKRKYCECDDPSIPHHPEDHLITPVRSRFIEEMGLELP